MSNPGRNEGFRLLEDFPCQGASIPTAIPSNGLDSHADIGMRVLEETVLIIPSDEWLAELRSLNNGALLVLLQLNGSEMSKEALLAIHRIAIERIREREDPFFEEAVLITQKAMDAAVGVAR